MWCEKAGCIWRDMQAGGIFSFISMRRILGTNNREIFVWLNEKVRGQNTENSTTFSDIHCIL